jgi:hypothetical protein
MGWAVKSGGMVKMPRSLGGREDGPVGKRHRNAEKRVPSDGWSMSSQFGVFRKGCRVLGSEFDVHVFLGG